MNTTNHAEAQTEIVLREHAPVNVMHGSPSYPGVSAIQCLCDWTWRQPMQHAHHVAGALCAGVTGLSEGESSND